AAGCDRKWQGICQNDGKYGRIFDKLPQLTG
ncbi:MAG: hypothetical protein ACI83E_003131, partial [Sulfitobacter sp.]